MTSSLYVLPLWLLSAGSVVFAATETVNLLDKAPLVGEAGQSTITWISGNPRPTGWSHDIGKPACTAQNLQECLNAQTDLGNTSGWKAGVSTGNLSNTDIKNVTANEFGYNGRKAYAGEYVLMTVKLEDVLTTEGSTVTDLSVSGNITGSDLGIALFVQQDDTVTQLGTTHTSQGTFSITQNDQSLDAEDTVYLLFTSTSTGASVTVSDLKVNATVSTPDPDTPVDPDTPDEPDAPQPILPPDPSDSDLLEAGSTIPTLNMAQHRAFYNRMFQMRDRGVRLGLDQEHTHTDLPYYHLWITGTGSYTDLNMQADYAGYTLSTWGGSAGADFNVNEHWSLGVALAADYGKLKATSYDEHAEADLDTYSLHFYTRYQQARWGHLFLIGGALSRATVERTMYIANDHWNTSGKTNGFGIGAMYELTYDVPLNEERSAILQPLFNLSFASTRFDAYQERLQGTDATVDIHQQTHTTGTAAVGVRYLAQTGTNLFGRAVIAELRANVAQDFGDRQARVNGELVGESFTVRGAKVGMTALQAGAGITLPVGLQNAVFLHVNGDVRSKQYSVSGTLGWRYSF